MIRQAVALCLLCVFTSIVAYGDGTTTSPATRPGVAAPKVVPLLSTEEIKGVMAEGKYPQALLSLQKVMGLRNNDAAAYNRHEILMLVAECRMHMHQIAATFEVLELAHNEAANDHNWSDNADALALSGIVHLSPTLTFTPRTGDDRKPLSLLDLSARKTAFASVYTQKIAECTDMQNESQGSETLNPLMKVGPSFLLAKSIDQVLHHHTNDSDKVGTEITRWAGKLIIGYMRAQNEAMNQVEESSGIGEHGARGRRVPGLNNDQITLLQNIIRDCKSIPDALSKLSYTYLLPPVQNAMECRTEALRTMTRARNILDEDARYKSGKTTITGFHFNN